MLAALFLVTATSCVDPLILDRQLDEMLLALRPGLSLDEVASVTNQPRDQLLPVQGRVLVHVAANGGHRVASVLADCVYTNERLGECKVSGPRQHVQFIEPEAYNKVKVGHSIGAALVALCQPEGLQVAPDGAVTLSYSIAFPFEAYMPYGPATFSFDRDGKFRQKSAAGR